jgi:CubicO group peptidase (beta-lactamase class C family)
MSAPPRVTTRPERVILFPACTSCTFGGALVGAAAGRLKSVPSRSHEDIVGAVMPQRVARIHGAAPTPSETARQGDVPAKAARLRARSRLVAPSFALTMAAFLTSCASRPVPCAPEPGAPSTKREQIEAAVGRFITSTRTPGVAIAVVEGGNTSFTQDFGSSDIENPTHVGEHTLFRLGSISKLFTAVLALRLWEQGKLDLDAPVQRYCPGFPEKPWTISTRQVLAHAGGIRHYKSEAPDDPEIANTKHCKDPIADGLAFFAGDPLIAPPGTQFHYSTQGYTLIGCVLEGATRGKYAELVGQNVLYPAGMRETLPDDRLAVIAGRTRFYRKAESGEGVLNADPLDSCYKLPGGGWLSTSRDMARFAIALLSDQLLQRRTRDVMWHPVRPIGGTSSAYALGWVVSQNDGIDTLAHTGGQQGTSTVLVMAPARRAAVVILANMEKVPVVKLAHELLKIVLG